MKKLWIIAIIFLIACCAGAEVKSAYITSDNGLRVRSEPSLDGEILEVLPYRTEVGIISEVGDWYKIKNGYIYKKYVAEDESESMKYLGYWHITAYTATGSPCAYGNYPTDGYTVACNSLDFGTKIYIEGVGYRTVEDRGPEWLGSEWLDLYMDSYDSCVQWGSQYRNVYFVGE